MYLACTCLSPAYVLKTPHLLCFSIALWPASHSDRLTLAAEGALSTAPNQYSGLRGLAPGSSSLRILLSPSSQALYALLHLNRKHSTQGDGGFGSIM